MLHNLKRMAHQVIVDGEEVFQGNMRHIGGGGTKTAYELVGTDKVVLLPNEVDGQRLVNIFERICDEEVYMYNYLASINLLGLPVTKCVVVQPGGREMLGLYAPSFQSFQKIKAHVIDTKHLLGCTWDPQSRFHALDEHKEVDWLPVFQTLHQDLVQAANNGLLLRGDSFNLLLAEPGSPHYTGTGAYALRYFGFDFSSKRFAMTRPTLGEPHFTNVCDVLAMMEGSSSNNSLQVVEQVVNLAMIEAIDVMDCLLGQLIVKPQVEAYLKSL